MKRRPINVRKREKLVDNVTFFLQTDSTSTIEGLLNALREKLNGIRYLEDLNPEEIRALAFLGKWRYEKLIDESDGMEGISKSKLIMNATCWRQHYSSLENLLKKRGQLFSCPQNLK